MGCGSGGLDTSVHDLSIKMCTDQGCKSTARRVALEQTSMNTRDLVSTKEDALTLKYQQGLGGPRVYLIEKEGFDTNMMFGLPDQEFTFDVELSTMGCGFNAALYFVGMTENQGGALHGTNYCDAQAVGGTFCSEMDIFEGNTKTQVYTTHGCIDKCAQFTDTVEECARATMSQDQIDNVCDHSGCGINPFRYGANNSYNEDWYGAGAGFSLDASKVFTVTTQFHKDNITRFYFQGGKRIDLPTLYPGAEALKEPALEADYCDATYDRWSGGAEYEPMAQMLKNLENGMVLAMSVWYDKETNGQGGMSWMDGNNSWGKVGPCTETTSDDGDHQATFSNIRFGPIGTTTDQETLILETLI
jgi:cellulose 1,4-beta-cellobiosidase